MSTTLLNTNATSPTPTLDAQNLDHLADKITGLGRGGLRFTIAGVLGWIGAMKFTAYEAGAIQGLVASSPLTSWLYNVTSVQGASNLIGSIEILTAIGLLLGLKFARVGVVAAAAAAFTFLLTLSFLFTAPGWEASLGGFPALSVVPGQFLLKDVVLLAGAVFLVGQELKRVASNNR